MTYDPSELDPEGIYTAACHARCHLEGLSTAFADGNDVIAPDPDVCHAVDFPELFAVLVRGWHRCQDAAHIIHSRYQQDWEHGGALTVIAPRVRDLSLRELAGVWKSLCAKYISETLDKDRAAWDCTFCGTNMPPSAVVDEDRCGNCMVILWMNAAETDWTSEWEETH